MNKKPLKYRHFTKEEKEFWEKIEVNIRCFCDKWKLYKPHLFNYFKKFSIEELKEILDILNIDYKEGDDYKKIILENTQESIILYCLLDFSKKYYKLINQILALPLKKGGGLNKNLIFIKCLTLFKQNKLMNLFVKLKKIQFGNGYSYEFKVENNEDNFQKFIIIINSLIKSLYAKDQYTCKYKYRHAVKEDDKWIFLLIKETEDKIYPAIPNNQRLIKGSYIIITIYPSKDIIEINTSSRKIRNNIKTFISKKSENKVKYNTQIINYDPDVSMRNLLKKEDDELVLIGFSLKDAIAKRTTWSDPEGKNPMNDTLQTLIDKKLIYLKKFTEFGNLSFRFKGIKFSIKVIETIWGQEFLKLQMNKKPPNELADFIKKFENIYCVKLNRFLNKTNTQLVKKDLIRTLLNNDTIKAFMPPEADKALVELMENKLINKPTRCAKRICKNCNELNWKKDCASCGSTEQYFKGDYLNLKINEQNISRFILKRLKGIKELKVKQITKTIHKNPFKFIEIMNKQGDLLSIFLSKSNINPKVINHFSESGNPLLIVLIRFKPVLAEEMEDQGFECLDVTDLLSINDSDFKKEIETSISNQKRKFQSKVSKKGDDSFNKILKPPTNYDDQDLEIDIYNLLHEIFLIGDRLGGKFTGVAAPDGIIAVHNHSTPLSKYCISWDCKYSRLSNGYKLIDKPQKHKHYIRTLIKNAKIKFYGGLKTYAIISNNMDQDFYEKFYSKLYKSIRWKGNIIFIDSKIIMAIYEFYKNNYQTISKDPSIFFKELFKLFSIIYKKHTKPFPEIKEERLNIFFNKLEEKYKRYTLDFAFKRSEFKKTKIK